MPDLTDFASLPLDELTAELERMLDNHHQPRRVYDARPTSPLTAAGVIAAPLPQEHAAVGNFLEQVA